MKTGALLAGIAIALLAISNIATACVQDSDCPGGQVCDNSICTVPSSEPPPGCSCIYDSQCNADQVCNCVCQSPPSSGECLNDHDCDRDQVCEGGVCQSRPPPPPCTDGATCDDGNACNGVETCASGSCQPGTPPVCDDGNACNGVESCDPAAGCRPGTPMACDDGKACNGLETCDPAKGCQPGTPLVCGNAPCVRCVEPNGCVEVDLPPGNPHMMCDGVCVNTQNNDEFCGGCTACDEGFKCKQDACVEVPNKKKK